MAPHRPRARRAHVVIGSGYGDEGKGLMTDFLAARSGSRGLVIRANGGAQAGHTVVTEDGRRHVFGHVGSGAFAGSPTYLSRFFVSCPMVLGRELGRLADLGIRPRLLVDPDSPVTTPWDILINQVSEMARAQGRHGSCGLGFGETLERSGNAEFSLRVRDLDRPGLRDRLARIRDVWAPRRLAALGVVPDAEHAGYLVLDSILDRFLEDVGDFLSSVSVSGVESVRDADQIVFEGAQGLLLDMDRGAFPYVTRSNTGLRNPLQIAREAGLEGLDVTYATRAYATRHGAGPLAHELPKAPSPLVVDQTNAPNAWQGTLRFARLDLDLLSRTVAADLTDASGSCLDISYRVAVTCLDQFPDGVDWYVGGRQASGSAWDLVRSAAAAVGGEAPAVSHGPSRLDVMHPAMELAEL